DLGEVRRWQHVRLVTLAPECVAESVIEFLVGAGIVVACGHSEATFEQAKRAFDLGARYVTHLFNAMSPLHHRLPGLVGAALSDSRITVGLIADGVHVHAEATALAFRLAAERLNLVSDAIALGATPSLGGQSPTLVDGVPRLADGTLAGSALRLDEAVRNLRRFTGCSIADALATVTTIPGDLLGLDQRIAVGSPADLVILNDDLTVACTIAGGRVIFKAC
ncbi:MAG: N-acetylglucosamine-6-phosphate deacetylase, partial [Myxococcota bacterium]